MKKTRRIARRLASGLMAAIMCVSTVWVTPIETRAEGNVPAVMDSASAVNYAVILGRATDFGIVANEFEQKMHMETTIATNKFININNNNDVDFISGTAQFLFGAVAEGSTIRFGKTTANTFNIEATSQVLAGYQKPYIMKAEDVAKLDGNGIYGNFTYDSTFRASNVALSITESSATVENVKRIIKNGEEKSDELSVKAQSDDYALNYRAYGRDDGGAHYTITLPADTFRNKVVYINVDAYLAGFLAKTSGLKIIKDSSTIVVFNVEDDSALLQSGNHFRIDKIEMSVDGGVSWIDSSTASNGGNAALEDKEICQKVIWNIRTTAPVDINIGAGTFLIPNSSLVDVVGSSAGWVVTNSHMQNSGGEWHYVYKGGSQDVMTDTINEIHFAARKAFTRSYNGAATVEDTTVYSEAGQYTFAFYETNEEYKQEVLIDSRSNQATNAVKFPTLTFYTDAGNDNYNIPSGGSKNFYYLIKETGTSNPYGIDKSNGYITIHLVVTNTDGKLSYEVYSQTVLGNGTIYKTNGEEGVGGIQMSGVEFGLGAFFNLIPSDGEDDSVATLSIQGTKKLVNSSTEEDIEIGNRRFNFTITANSGNPKAGTINGGDSATVQNSGNTIYFPQLKFSAPGIYTYTIEELAGNEINTYDYDEKTYTVTVEVTNDNGVLKAIPTYPEGGIVFTNKVKISGSSSIDIKLTAHKTVTGKDAPSPMATFQFELLKENLSGLAVETEQNNANGDVTFTSIKGLGVGRYTYYIREVRGIESGYTYDNTVYEATVNVYDTGTGLDYTVSYRNLSTGNSSAQPPEFVNRYQLGSASVTLEAKKVLTGRDVGIRNNEFRFLLYEQNGDTRTQVGSAYARPDGTIAFTIQYTSPEAVGEHIYVMEEAGAGQTIYGVKYSAEKYVYVVEVKDAGGTLSAAIKSVTNAETNENVDSYIPTFTNKYNAASTTVTLRVHKVVTGDYILSGGEFEFQLFDSNNNLLNTTTNDAAGNVEFTTEEFNTEEPNLVYYIREVDPATEEKLSGFNYTNAGTVGEIKATVTITDDHYGNLVADITYDKNATISNAYQAPTPEANTCSYQIRITKEIIGRSLVAGEFTFGLYDNEDKLIASAGNTADGTVTFKPLSLAYGRDYHYTVREVQGNTEFVVYDTTPIQITLSVDESGNVTQTPDRSQARITNRYNAPTSIYLDKTDISGSVEVSGATLRLTQLSGTMSLFKTKSETGVRLLRNGSDLNEQLIDRTVSSITFVSGEAKTLVTGLRDGEYTLEEIIAPKGYQTLSSTIRFTISNGKVTAIHGVDGEYELSADGLTIRVKDEREQTGTESSTVSDSSSDDSSSSDSSSSGTPSVTPLESVPSVMPSVSAVLSAPPIPPAYPSFATTEPIIPPGTPVVVKSFVKPGTGEQIPMDQIKSVSWERYDPVTDIWVEIPDQHEGYYVPTEADRNTTIRVRIIYEETDGTPVTVYSNPTRITEQTTNSSNSGLETDTTNTTRSSRTTSSLDEVPRTGQRSTAAVPILAGIGVVALAGLATVTYFRRREERE